MLVFKSKDDLKVYARADGGWRVPLGFDFYTEGWWLAEKGMAICSHLLNFSPLPIVIYFLFNEEDLWRATGMTSVGSTYPGLIFRGKNGAVIAMTAEITEQQMDDNYAKAKCLHEEAQAEKKRASLTAEAARQEEVQRRESLAREVRKLVSPKLRSAADAEVVRPVVGEQNYHGIIRALADGASLWVFFSEEEIRADPELSTKEKQGTLEILREEKLGYAGWVRTPPHSERPPIAGFEPVPGTNTHGNSVGGGGGSEGNRRH